MLALHVSSERHLKVSLTALQNECLAPGSCCHFSENLVSHPPTPTRFWIACPWQTGAEEPYLSVPTCHCTVEHSQLSQRPWASTSLSVQKQNTGMNLPCYEHCGQCLIEMPRVDASCHLRDTTDTNWKLLSRSLQAGPVLVTKPKS